MIQAARSGVQNIAEGSVASAASRKTEIRLTQVARASLEELRLGYEDFLRQGGYAQWERDNSQRQSLVDSRPIKANDVVEWIKTEAGGRSELYPELSANAARALIIVAGYLLDRQIRRLVKDFEEAGYAEPLTAKSRRRKSKK